MWFYSPPYTRRRGNAVAQWLRCCATNQKVAGSIPTGVSEFFIDIKSFRSHYGPGVDSDSNRNEYQEYFLGVKAAGAYGWQPYHHPMPLSWNLGTLTSWNPLGNSRPVMGLLFTQEEALLVLCWSFQNDTCSASLGSGLFLPNFRTNRKIHVEIKYRNSSKVLKAQLSTSQCLRN